jgi:hypothetical protein
MKYWIDNGDKRGGFLEEFVEGSVEITDEYWQALIEQSNNGKIIRSDENGYPVAIEPAITVGQIRSTRDGLIAEIRWRVERHTDEVGMGMVPTEDISPVLKYIQDLRDITKQPGFPGSIIWPEI